MAKKKTSKSKKKKTTNKVGRPKNIKTPEEMWNYFAKYRDELKNNPILIIEQRKGSIILPKGLNAQELKDYLDPIVKLPTERPLTLDGFENWLNDNGVLSDLGDYFKNKDNRYSQFAPICSRIKRVIRQDQIEGGMAGIYNPSITQRLNNLAEHIQSTIQEQPLFGPDE